MLRILTLSGCLLLLVGCRSYNIVVYDITTDNRVITVSNVKDQAAAVEIVQSELTSGNEDNRARTQVIHCGGYVTQQKTYVELPHIPEEYRGDDAYIADRLMDYIEGMRIYLHAFDDQMRKCYEMHENLEQ